MDYNNYYGEWQLKLLKEQIGNTGRSIPFQDGYNSICDGICHIHNPFREAPKSEAFLEWEKGWVEGGGLEAE